MAWAAEAPGNGGVGDAATIQWMVMTQRRYGDEEVREIFSLATTGEVRGQSLPAEADGLTLDEIQRIGQEAGIEPEQVARAAERLDARGQSPEVRRSLGLPIGVSRVVDLPRAPTDREWEQLVAEFRSTFGTQGHTMVSGGLRDWSVGNLHVAVEPTAQGERLRLTTVKGDGVALNWLGLIMGVLAVVMTTVVAATGRSDQALEILGMFGGLALAALAANAIRLPLWVRERRRQMEAIIEHTMKLLSD